MQKLIQLILTYRLRKWSAVLLCLVSFLCAHISSAPAQEKNAEQCFEYFEEIMEIQKFREILKIGASEMIERYDRGELSKEELDTTLAVWHTTESELQQRVAKIYDTAYAEKCFDSVVPKEAR